LRFSDKYSIVDQTAHNRYRQFVSSEIVGAGLRGDKNKDRPIFLGQKVDWHQSQTLTTQMQDHLNSMCKKVLTFINEQHMKVESASFHWIITKREKVNDNMNEDDLMFPGDIQLIDIKHVVFQ